MEIMFTLHMTTWIQYGLKKKKKKTKPLKFFLKKN